MLCRVVAPLDRVRPLAAEANHAEALVEPVPPDVEPSAYRLVGGGRKKLERVVEIGDGSDLQSPPPDVVQSVFRSDEVVDPELSSLGVGPGSTSFHSAPREDRILRAISAGVGRDRYQLDFPRLASAMRRRAGVARHAFRG